jgi:TM2 domain-containing membrane protein YozV
MQKSTKAVLLSALVFPGAGHLYLKRWVEGILLAGVAAYALYFIVSLAMDIALDISSRIESGAVSPDIDSITTLVSQQLAGVEQASNLASIVLVVCWVLGMVGAYWQGRVQDKADMQQKRNPSGDGVNL